MSLKNKIKYLILGYRATTEAYIKYLRSKGVKVGENVKIFRPFNTTIDVQNPHLLIIGNDVQIFYLMSIDDLPSSSFIKSNDKRI